MRLQPFTQSADIELTHMELSSELSSRFLPSLTKLGVTLFDEAGLVQLIIDKA